MDTKTNFSRTTIVLHWLVAASIIGQTLHGLLGYLLLTLIVLHAAAALKHHFVDKDASLKRMLGRTSKST